MENRSSSADLSYPTLAPAGVAPRPLGQPARPTLRVVGRLPLPKAILFDLDGTLIDTMQVFADVAADVMAAHHGMNLVAARAAYLATSGIPFFQQLEVIVPGDRRNAAAAAEFEVRKLVAVAHVGASTETLDTLSALRALGVAIAVCSNNFQKQVDEFVATCPVSFDLALGFGNGLAKGHTQFEHARQTFGCRTEDLLFVGDSVADAQLAMASNIEFVARLGTFGADAFVAVSPASHAVTELPEQLTLFAR